MGLQVAAWAAARSAKSKGHLHETSSPSRHRAACPRSPRQRAPSGQRGASHGTFPLDGYTDEALSGAANNDIFIDGYDVISDDEVRGEVSGSFEEGGGWDREIIDATFVMTR